MDEQVLELSDRGQITIPNKIRKQFSMKRFICSIQDGSIVLEPLQTKEEFLNELDDIEKDYKKSGGLNLKQIKDKYKLS